MSETLNNHEEMGGDGQESLMASLAEEAGKFDPQKAMEARAQRMANRVGGAHLKPEGEAVDGGQERLDDREYREKTNVPKMELFMKRMEVIEKQFPILAEEVRSSRSGDEAREWWHLVVNEVPESVTMEHGFLDQATKALARGITDDYNSAGAIRTKEYDAVVVDKPETENAEWIFKNLGLLHEKNSEIVDFSHEEETDISERSDYTEYLKSFGEMRKRKIASGGGLHLKQEGKNAERLDGRVGGAHLESANRTEGVIESNEDLEKDRAMVGEINKIEDRDTRELLIACLPVFYRNTNWFFVIEHRHEVLEAMLKYPKIKGKELISFSDYMRNLSEKFVESGDGKRAHMYYELVGNKRDDKFTLPYGPFAQMEVGNDIEKCMREHVRNATYSIVEYKCYELYKDRLKQGKEIMKELS